MQSHFSSARLALALAATTCTTMLAAPAAADTVNKALMSSPTGLCQAALPNYEGNIRKRPLAVVNEGIDNAFVTCSFPGFSTEDLTSYVINFRNRSSVDITIDCTAVNGSETVGTPLYVPKSRLLQPNGTVQVTWVEADGINTTLPTSLSCMLPPGAAIANIYVNQQVEIGQ